MNSQIEDIINDPDYDQSQLQDYFRNEYGADWRVYWFRYLETGTVP